MLLPSASTSPVVGRKRPAMILKSVDLPHPLGPIRLIRRPSRMVSDTGSSARTVRPSRLKIFETVRTSSLRVSTVSAVFVIAMQAAIRRPERGYGGRSKLGPLSIRYRGGAACTIARGEFCIVILTEAHSVVHFGAKGVGGAPDGTTVASGLELNRAG